ncbi:polysaccharide pyruvyl transferase family protein [Kiritimatiellaeota bacterium B1221]|nr:polysaccharide pyruvyl transferase family protein [Kiritimatiellaeota bacterium B1221]
MSKLNSITLLGSASGRNAGDAALIAAIMDGVDEACGRRLRYEIPTIRADYIRDEYPNNSVPVGMMPWHGALRMLGIPTLRSILRTDAILIFDACLFDRSLFNPLFNFLSSFYLMLPLAKKRGVPIIGFNVGVGPVHTKSGKKMLKKVVDMMDFITVRDQDSLDLLREVGVENTRVQLAADAALNAPSGDEAEATGIYEKAGIDIHEAKLGINVNRYLDTWASADRESMGKEKFLDVFSAALIKVHAELNVPIVFVTTQHHDIEVTQDLIDRLPSEIRTARIDNRDYNHAKIKGVLRHIDLLCGMRLHSLIMASAELAPVVGITYQPKVAYYFRELELPERTVSFDDFTPESLSTLILDGWRDKAALSTQLHKRIPVLKAKAAWSAELMAAFDQGGDQLENIWERGPRIPETNSM